MNAEELNLVVLFKFSGLLHPRKLGLAMTATGLLHPRKLGLAMTATGLLHPRKLGLAMTKSVIAKRAAPPVIAKRVALKQSRKFK